MNSENTIIFTIARMNPPTPGHLQLIEYMIDITIKENVNQINIILSSTVDSQKNPIECEEKRQLLYNYLVETAKKNSIQKHPNYVDKINNLNFEIICMNDEVETEFLTVNPVIGKIKYILYKLYGYPRADLKVILVIGEDRKNDFLFLKKSVNDFDNTNQYPITFEIDVVDRPENAISATKIRGLATSRDELDEQKFLTHMNSVGIQNTDANELLGQIRTNINVSNTLPKTKKIRTQGGKKKKRNGKSKTTRRIRKNKTKTKTKKPRK
jgi:nicotinic acid mononucleotide adenylyltransferase